MKTKKQKIENNIKNRMKKIKIKNITKALYKSYKKEGKTNKK